MLNERPSADTRPRLQAEETPYGMRYVAIRRPFHDPDTMQYVRVTAWAAPFYVQIPANDKYTPAQVFVPIDEHNTFLYFIAASNHHVMDQDDWRRRTGGVVGSDVDENYRKLRTLQNTYLQDRAAMGEGLSFTGIHGLMTQDMAMQETMGPIVDRSREHLGTSDVAIIKYRRLLLSALREFQEGAPTLGLGGDVDPAEILSVEGLIQKEQTWQDWHAQKVAELRVQS
jgi:phthalate 4,5-dioxygenase oxygenase subunit